MQALEFIFTSHFVGKNAVQGPHLRSLSFGEAEIGLSTAPALNANIVISPMTAVWIISFFILLS
jgi:hypothetical protein